MPQPIKANNELSLLHAATANDCAQPRMRHVLSILCNTWQTDEGAEWLAYFIHDIHETERNAQDAQYDLDSRVRIYLETLEREGDATPDEG